MLQITTPGYCLTEERTNHFATIHYPDIHELNREKDWCVVQSAVTEQRPVKKATWSFDIHVIMVWNTFTLGSNRLYTNLYPYLNTTRKNQAHTHTQIHTDKQAEMGRERSKLMAECNTDKRPSEDFGQLKRESHKWDEKQTFSKSIEWLVKFEVGKGCTVMDTLHQKKEFD